MLQFVATHIFTQGLLSTPDILQKKHIEAHTAAIFLKGMSTVQQHALNTAQTCPTINHQYFEHFQNFPLNNFAPNRLSRALIFMTGGFISVVSVPLTVVGSELEPSTCLRILSSS